MYSIDNQKLVMKYQALKFMEICHIRLPSTIPNGILPTNEKERVAEINPHLFHTLKYKRFHSTQ